MNVCAIISTCVLSTLLLLGHQPQPISAGLEHTCDGSERVHPQGFCGRNLVNAVTRWCAYLERHNAGRVKRDTIPQLASFGTESSFGSKLGPATIKRADAFSVLTKRDNGAAGSNIVCECCINDCGAYEMAQYCDLARSLLLQ